MEFNGLSYDNEAYLSSGGNVNWWREKDAKSTSSTEDYSWVPALGQLAVNPLPPPSFWTPDLREGASLQSTELPQDAKPEDIDPSESSQQATQESDNQSEDFKTIPIQKAKKTKEVNRDGLSSSSTKSQDIPEPKSMPEMTHHPGKQWTPPFNPGGIGNVPFPKDFYGVPYPPQLPWPQMSQDQYLQMTANWYSQQWYHWQSLYSSMNMGLPHGPMPPPLLAPPLAMNEAPKREQQQDWLKKRSFPTTQASLVGNTLKESQTAELIETLPSPATNRNKEALMMMFNSKKEDYDLNSSRLAQKDREKIDKLYQKYNIYNYSKDLREIGSNPYEETSEAAKESLASVSLVDCVQNDQAHLPEDLPRYDVTERKYSSSINLNGRWY